MQDTQSDPEEKKNRRRLQVTIDQDDYDYMQSHFIKFSPIIEKAIKDYIAEEKAKLLALKREIPANVNKPFEMLDAKGNKVEFPK